MSCFDYVVDREKLYDGKRSKYLK